MSRALPLPRRGARRSVAALRTVTALRSVVGLILGALVAASLIACSPVASEPKIALLLPDNYTARYETFDRPLFEKRVAELGRYQVLYANAGQDAAAQQQQAESALASGARVLVLDPVDSKSAAGIVAAARAQNVPVIAYDRLISGGGLAYYVSFDNEKVGMQQATALVDAMTARGDPHGGILVVNGSPTDSNAVLFRQGAHRVLDRSGLTVLAEYDTPGWSADKAQEWVAGQIAQYGDRISGVYAANDGVAGGAIAAFAAANLPIPPVTGQDAELSAVQRIVAGQQYMTVYKALKPEADHAAEAAVALAEGRTVTARPAGDGTPTTLLEPVPVTVDDIEQTVIADGFWSAKEICTPAYAQACTAAGIR